MSAKKKKKKKKFGKKVLFWTGCAHLCDVQQLNSFSVVDLRKHFSSPACQVRGAAEVNF